jgi:hypothetical protein
MAVLSVKVNNVHVRVRMDLSSSHRGLSFGMAGVLAVGGLPACRLGDDGSRPFGQKGFGATD